MNISLGNAFAVTAQLQLAKRAFSRQKIKFTVYLAGDAKRENPLLSATQTTDTDGEALVSFDSNSLEPTDHVVDVSYETLSKTITITLPFTVIETGTTLDLTTDSDSFEAGTPVNFTATVLTASGRPKVGVTVTFTDVDTNQQWTAVTNSAGQATIRIDTDINDDRDMTIKADFAGATDTKTVTIRSKISLVLRGDKTTYKVGETAKFTATLLKGDKPYVDQTIDFSIN